MTIYTSYTEIMAQLAVADPAEYPRPFSVSHYHCGKHREDSGVSVRAANYAVVVVWDDLRDNPPTEGDLWQAVAAVNAFSAETV